MSIATLKTDLLALEASFTSPIKPGNVLRAAAAVEVDAADVLDLFMATPPGAAPDPDKAECVACCRRLETKCKAAPPAPVGAPAPVGKIGDGKILELMLKLLPIILALFGETPTP